MGPLSMHFYITIVLVLSIEFYRDTLLKYHVDSLFNMAQTEFSRRTTFLSAVQNGRVEVCGMIITIVAVLIELCVIDSPFLLTTFLGDAGKALDEIRNKDEERIFAILLYDHNSAVSADIASGGGSGTRTGLKVLRGFDFWIRILGCFCFMFVEELSRRATDAFSRRLMQQRMSAKVLLAAQSRQDSINGIAQHDHNSSNDRSTTFPQYSESTEDGIAPSSSEQNNNKVVGVVSTNTNHLHIPGVASTSPVLPSPSANIISASTTTATNSTSAVRKKQSIMQKSFSRTTSNGDEGDLDLAVEQKLAEYGRKVGMSVNTAPFAHEICDDLSQQLFCVSADLLTKQARMAPETSHSSMRDQNI